MSRSRLILGIVFIGILSAITAVAQGYLDGQLENDQQRAELAAKLEELPESFGDWKRLEASDLPKSAAQILQCYGHVNHVYWNSKTGSQVSVAVLLGPRGPIAVHTPDICYQSVGTVPEGSREATYVSDEKESDRFWRIRFRTDREPKPHLEVWYAWSDGGPWYASENPRFWMTQSLYKIQVAAKPAADGNQSDCQLFLKDFLPILRNRIGRS